MLPLWQTKEMTKCCVIFIVISRKNQYKVTLEYRGNDGILFLLTCFSTGVCLLLIKLLTVD